MDKKTLTVLGSTVPFTSHEIEGIEYIEFDTRLCTPPEPMVNLVCGLKLLDAKDKRVVMLNMQEPTPFYPRIADEVMWIVTPLENGDVRIVFLLR